MQKLQKIITLAVTLSFISACGMKNAERSLAAEEAAVYSALINEQLEVPFSYLMGDPILIVSSTVYETIDDDYLYDSAPTLDKDTVEDFKEVNKQSQILDLSLSLNKPYEYVTLPSDENGWLEFEQKYPNAYQYHCRRPTARVTRWWAGGDNAILLEPTSSHANCLKTRRLPPVGYTLC